MGSALFGDYRSRHEAYVVRRLKDAGFVLVGHTNSLEFGIVPVTEPRRCGATRNPWDATRTPGGSSGGAAGRCTPFTPVFNVSGQPALTLPLFMGNDGPPLAVQLVAAPLGKSLLLSLAAQLEVAHPWASRLPPPPPPPLAPGGG